MAVIIIIFTCVDFRDSVIKLKMANINKTKDRSTGLGVLSQVGIKSDTLDGKNFPVVLVGGVVDDILSFKVDEIIDMAIVIPVFKTSYLYLNPRLV